MSVQQYQLSALNRIIDLVPGHIYWKDINGTYLGCNKEQAISLGLTSPEELIGKTDFDISEKHLAEKFAKADRKVIQSQAAATFEETIQLLNGEKATVLSKKTPLYDDNNQLIGVLGVSFDITAEKEAEKLEHEKQVVNAKIEAEKKLRQALLTFSGMITHDLKTPLTTLNLCSTELTKAMPGLLVAYKKCVKQGISIPNISPDLLKTIPGFIKNVFKQMNSQINNTHKNLKRIANGMSTFSYDDLTLCHQWKCLDTLSKYPFKEGERELVHIDRSNADYTFMGNIIYTITMYENLLKNALEEIADKGQGEVFISCEIGDKFNIVKFKDTVGGITQELIDGLFKDIQTTKTGGTGIGLASVKEIMHAFGGDVSANLVDSDCIEFVLRFPKVTNTH